MFDGHEDGAHRFAYGHFRGPIPEGYLVEQLCQNRRCVNPDHLGIVTAMESLMRQDRSHIVHSASVTHCPAGHPYDEANTSISNLGRRLCRACGRAKPSTLNECFP